MIMLIDGVRKSIECLLGHIKLPFVFYRYLKERGTFKRNRGGFIVYSKGKRDAVKTDIYHQMTLEEWERSLKL